MWGKSKKQLERAKRSARIKKIQSMTPGTYYSTYNRKSKNYMTAKRRRNTNRKRRLEVVRDRPRNRCIISDMY